MVHFDPFGHSRSTTVLFSLFGFIWSYSVHFGPLCSIQSSLVYLVLFHQLRSISLIQSTLVHLVLFVPIQSTSVLFGPLCVPIQSILVLFGPLCSIRSTSVLLVIFSPSSLIWSFLVHYGPIRSNLVILGPLLSYSVLLVLFGLRWSIYFNI